MRNVLSPLPPTEPLLSVAAVAARLGVAIVTVRAWIRTGRLPAVRLGRRVLVRPERLSQWIVAREVGVGGRGRREREAQP